MSEHTHISDVQMRPEAAGWFATALSRPKLVLWTGVTLLIAVGWTYLFLMVLEVLPRTDMAQAGFGMAVFNVFSDWATLGEFSRELLRAICGPSQTLYADGGAAIWTVRDVGLVLAMWIAMTLAMMVPTAAPMIATYADISLTAKEKGITIVPTTVLIAGYLVAWGVFCVLATGAQWALTKFALITPQLTLNSGYVAAVVLILAGIYQFTPWKKVCLSKCRTPLPFFMANWSDRVGGVFKMGLSQGVFCVMCCWALMTVMFAVGLMNVIWMAALAVIMALEKILADPRFVVQGTGIALIGFGVALIATA